MPERIQMSRRHVWRPDHPDAVRVDRATKYGNPYRVEQSGATWVVQTPIGATAFSTPDRNEAAGIACALYYADLCAGRLAFTLDEVRGALAGRDLACWCGLEPGLCCHADVLLMVANGRPHTAPVKDSATGVTTVWVQRCCSGCSEELGDAQHWEVIASMAGLGLPDSRMEHGCGRAEA